MQLQVPCSRHQEPTQGLLVVLVSIDYSRDAENLCFIMHHQYKEWTSQFTNTPIPWRKGWTLQLVRD